MRVNGSIIFIPGRCSEPGWYYFVRQFAGPFSYSNGGRYFVVILYAT